MMVGRDLGRCWKDLHVTGLSRPTATAPSSGAKAQRPVTMPARPAEVELWHGPLPHDRALDLDRGTVSFGYTDHHDHRRKTLRLE